jgi:Inositol 1,3,4-trisphosphate 5/6-kinase pre-ATP-grasp domain
MSLPLVVQGPFHLVIQKLNDALQLAKKGHVESITLLSYYSEYMIQFPSTIVVDPIDHLNIVLDRRQLNGILDSLSHLQDTNILVPKWTYLDSISDVRDGDFLFHFPASKKDS